MANEQSPGGAPAGSRIARIQAGLTGVLRESGAVADEDLPPGAQHVLCDLMAVLACGQGSLDLAMARLAARIRRTGALSGTGHATVAGLLREHGRSSAQASAIATVADHLEDYPRAVAAAEDGALAFAQLALTMDACEKAVAGRPVDLYPDEADYRARAEGIMVQAASSGVADRTLKRIGRELPQRISPQEHERRRREAYADRGARTTTDAFGFTLEAWGDAASEEIVRTALDSHLSPPGDGRTIEQRRFDALVQLCENRLIAEGLPVPEVPAGSDAHTALTGPRVDGAARRGANRPQVSLVVSLEALRGEEGAEPAVTDRARLLPPSAARAFASDSLLRRIATDPVKGVVDVGRARRTFPAHLRQALSATTATCQWEEGCSVPVRWCQGDHRTEWWEGGSTSVGNGQMLCGRHNREKHMRRMEARFRARTDPGEDGEGPLPRAA